MALTVSLAKNDFVEYARSGRSSCQGCGEGIEAGAPRYAKAFPGYDDEISHMYFHLTCGAKDSRQRFGLVVERFKDEFPALIEAYAAVAPKRANGGEFPYIEVATTGRAKCLHCAVAIAKGDERIAVEREFEVGGHYRSGAGYLHLKCAPTFTKQADIVTRARTGAPAAPAAPAAKAPAAQASTALKLEDEICQSPDNAARYLVWADALQADGDPLGELIVSAPTPRFQEVLEKHGVVVFGEHVFPQLGKILEIDWRNGVPDAVRVFAVTREQCPITFYEALASQLFSRRALRFVRSVKVCVAYSEYEHIQEDGLEIADLGWAIDALTRAKLPLLEDLSLGGWDEARRPLSGVSESPWVPPCIPSRLAKLLAAQPRLRKLHLDTNATNLAGCSLPALATLKLVTDPTIDMLKSLSSGAEALRSLSIEFRKTYIEPKPLLAALESFAKLEDLSLIDYGHHDLLLTRLVSSSLLQRLKSLRLQGSKLTKLGLNVATTNAGAFAHLTSVNLSNPKAAKVARETFEKALSAAQTTLRQPSTPTKKQAVAERVVAELKEGVDLDWTNRLYSAREPSDVDTDWSVFAAKAPHFKANAQLVAASTQRLFATETKRLLETILRPAVPLEARVEALRCTLHSSPFLFSNAPDTWVQAWVEQGGLAFLRGLGPLGVQLRDGTFDEHPRYGSGTPDGREELFPAGVADQFSVIQKAIWRLPEARFNEELAYAKKVWPDCAQTDQIFLACLFPQVPGWKEQLAEHVKANDKEERYYLIQEYLPMLLRIFGFEFQRTCIRVAPDDAVGGRCIGSFRSPAALKAARSRLNMSPSSAFANALLKQLERAPEWVLACWGDLASVPKAQRLIDLCRGNPAAVEAAQSRKQRT